MSGGALRRLSEEAMPLRAPRVRALGCPAQTKHDKAAVTLRDVLSEGAQTTPKCFSLPPCCTLGWKLQVAPCYLQRQVSPAKPRELQPGALTPGPRSSSAGNAQGMVPFAACPWHSKRGMKLSMDWLWVVKGVFSPPNPTPSRVSAFLLPPDTLHRFSQQEPQAV